MISILDLTDEVKWSQHDQRGAGSFGDVYKGDWNGQPVAVKKLRMFVCPTEKQKKVRQRMQRELKILHKLDHPNIIKLYGKITDHTSNQVYSMVFPWMDGGDLAHYLLEKRKDIPLNRRLDILHALSKGLEYLHTRNPVVMHGDLSAGNVLFDGNGVPYLSDFGMATILIDRETYQTSTVTENYRWCAPEYRSLHESTGPLKPTTEGDVYAFGSIIFTVLSGKLPYYYHKKLNPIVIRGKWPKRDEKILDPHWELIHHCWEKKPIDRPKIQDVVTKIEYFCNQRQYNEDNSPFGTESYPHAYPSFDPDKFTTHVMMLTGFPKDNPGFLKNKFDHEPTDLTLVDRCTQCPTSLFLTCKSKVYAAYESEGLLRTAILECCGKPWDQQESKDPKIFGRRYTEQDRDILKYERGTGFFLKWTSLVPYYTPHRRRRAFLMRSRDPEFHLPLETWRTQRQNETLLNQALNTGSEVYLLFCARQAQEIFGIARMEDAIPINAPLPLSPPPEEPENGPELGCPFRISWCRADDLQKTPDPQPIPFNKLLAEGDLSLRKGIAMIKGGRDGIELATDFLESLRAR